MDRESIQNSIKNRLNNNFTPTNADEIFQILSQKIAKYCQILSDLTNCEVFFKSNLNNNRSLYWGTYKTMFNYTHQGLQYDRNDSLIKISGRSLSSDIANIVEELLNVESLDTTSNNNETINEEKLILSTKTSAAATTTTTTDDSLELKECVVFMDRLDEQLYEHYLEKFEKSRVFVDEELLVEEMFSNLDQSSKMEVDGEEVEDEELFLCELCNQCSFKHIPELKLHILKEHEKVEIKSNEPFKCIKCNFELNNSTDYLNHLLLCYYPDLYSCKVCQQDYNSYSEYYYHKRYIHDTVYACTLCQRRFKDAQNLMEHDQLMHSKTTNFCEICFESLNSRRELQQHYKDKHITNSETNSQNSNRNILDITNYEKITAYKHPQIINNEFISIDSNNKNNEIITIKTLNNTIDSINDNNDSDSSSRVNNEENNDSDDYPTKIAIDNKMQKSELIRGLLDRKHQCKWCAQRFYTKSQLRQHESTHTNTVLFCPVCDKEFSHKDRLTGHMKCHMEPSLECKVCGKKFKRLCNLYNHELVHGLTEHAFMLCQFCGRGFRSRRDYQNHVIANHRDQLMKSEIIKNSNNGNNLNDRSILSEELQKTENKSYSSTKNRNIATNEENNSFNEETIDKSKKNKQQNYVNNNNTQLLVKAAEFVDNPNGNN